jgi:5'-phosphate synthase pdxT subunit
MVKGLSIGVLGIQGSISEHVNSMKKALDKANLEGQVLIVKNKEDIEKINGLIIPGGESTTIYKALTKSHLFDEILKRIQKHNLPIMGTCAGCVLLARQTLEKIGEIELLNAMDMQVQRNAFGRQKESFEQFIKINDFDKPFQAVFIRGPIIKKIWGDCKILSKINKGIIMTRQNEFLALSFHPELTEDIRIHQYFLKMIKSF